MSLDWVEGFFKCGKVLPTRSVAEQVDYYDLLRALQYHVNCNWENLSEEDRKKNLQAVREERGIVYSRYPFGEKFLYIITNFTTNTTAVLFEEELSGGDQ